MDNIEIETSKGLYSTLPELGKNIPIGIFSPCNCTKDRQLKSPWTSTRPVVSTSTTPRPAHLTNRTSGSAFDPGDSFNPLLTVVSFHFFFTPHASETSFRLKIRLKTDLFFTIPIRQSSESSSHFFFALRKPSRKQSVAAAINRPSQPLFLSHHTMRSPLSATSRLRRL